ncbi:hypothetical protein [Rudanella lutea]|uniref:hypothetical protein n=1 Tax=Rudanella lutea TaxID=451374 RepID=UPI00037F86FB|nr:hypothetical protein [Rudanella lutea]
MGNTTCIFCGKTREKAKEHVWPKWLQKEITGGTKQIFRGTHISNFLMQPLDERIQSGENLVLGNVCQVCNNGWMCELENDFRPLLLKILSNNNYLLHLSRKERSAVVLWAYKTAITINAASNYRKLVPDVHFKHIGKFKQLPRNVKVDIALIKKGKDLEWIQSPIQIALISRKENSEKFSEQFTTETVSYCIALQIRAFAMRVSFYENAKESNYSIDTIHSEKVLRLWPYEKNSQFTLKNQYEDFYKFQVDIAVIARRKSVHK